MTMKNAYLTFLLNMINNISTVLKILKWFKQELTMLLGQLSAICSLHLYQYKSTTEVYLIYAYSFISFNSMIFSCLFSKFSSGQYPFTDIDIMRQIFWNCFRYEGTHHRKESKAQYHSGVVVGLCHCLASFGFSDSKTKTMERSPRTVV